MKVFKINLGSDNPSPLSGRFWTKALVMALAIFICSLLFKFVDISSPLAAVVAALVISLLNAFIKPLLTLISAPLILMSFGLFQLIINAVIVLLTSHLVKGFHVGGLLDAVLFSIVVTFISFLLDLPIKIRSLLLTKRWIVRPRTKIRKKNNSKTILLCRFVEKLTSCSLVWSSSNNKTKQ